MQILTIKKYKKEIFKNQYLNVCKLCIGNKTDIVNILGIIIEEFFRRYLSLKLKYKLNKAEIKYLNSQNKYEHTMVDGISTKNNFFVEISCSVDAKKKLNKQLNKKQLLLEQVRPNIKGIGIAIDLNNRNNGMPLVKLPTSNFRSNKIYTISLNTIWKKCKEFNLIDDFTNYLYTKLPSIKNKGNIQLPRNLKCPENKIPRILPEKDTGLLSIKREPNNYLASYDKLKGLYRGYLDEAVNILSLIVEEYVRLKISQMYDCELQRYNFKWFDYDHNMIRDCEIDALSKKSEPIKLGIEVKCSINNTKKSMSKLVNQMKLRYNLLHKARPGIKMIGVYVDWKSTKSLTEEMANGIKNMHIYRVGINQIWERCNDMGLLDDFAEKLKNDCESLDPTINTPKHMEKVFSESTKKYLTELAKKKGINPKKIHYLSIPETEFNDYGMEIPGDYTTSKVSNGVILRWGFSQAYINRRRLLEAVK